MRWLLFFRDFDGRIGRKVFWLTSMGVFVVEAVIFVMAAIVVVAFAASEWWLEVVILVFLYPKFIIDVKRGHDRNISTWVIGAFYAAFVVREVLIEGGWLVEWPNQQVMSATNATSLAVTLLLGVVALALLIELGFRRGMPGPNRYGPDPLAPQI
jgi:uncharacterized membrane protein YhaH (DUF805 family)